MCIVIASLPWGIPTTLFSTCMPFHDVLGEGYRYGGCAIRKNSVSGAGLGARRKPRANTNLGAAAGRNPTGRAVSVTRMGARRLHRDLAASGRRVAAERRFRRLDKAAQTVPPATDALKRQRHHRPLRTRRSGHRRCHDALAVMTDGLRQRPSRPTTSTRQIQNNIAHHHHGGGCPCPCQARGCRCVLQSR